ncbi:MAG: hypothetical protein CMF61_05130 [Magnetococcales bacterium]|nr:hypothetical protein [Magnetococcales bacterium]|tara:strand:- start:259 stop:465 length:207 start_codon:yes stop_codon:yes gene_type:complete
MNGAKRLEQAFEKLETFLETNDEISTLSGSDAEKIKNLISENKDLKAKQKEAKKRLDKIITKIEKGGK